MFYDIPRVGNMIAARQLDFLGKTMRGPHDRPAQQMMTACCDNVHRVGCPFLHNKDFIVKNLRLLFVNVPEVNIDDYGSLKNWINEALDEKYWNDLLDCLTDRQASIPEQPAELPRPRQSPRNHDAPPPNQQPFPPTPPRTQRTRATEEPNSPEAPHSPPPINHHHRVGNDRPPLLLEPTTGETMTQSKSGEVCTTPSKFSALDLVPLNVRLSLHTKD
jgi:hypothetical protein